MNLKLLFETQKKLKEKIGYNEPDRFHKLVLAFLVELGECANEYRGFKFWSKNQQPRTKAVRTPAMMEEDKEYYNPLLEEYVDGLHFAIELCMDLGISERQLNLFIKYRKKTIGSLEYHFGVIYYNASSLMGYNNYTQTENSFRTYKMRAISIFNAYVGLGSRLGFTWDEIEQAYFKKNEVNHKRQDSGY
ncbi:dUTP diphosphatase [Priestia flexa]|uniref:dUTP diphosphatase n=1 Tax=Priestia flexa TaxID=86664 RepID=UPI003D018A00